MGVTHSPPKCFKLDSKPIRFEYLKGHANYSVLIRLGTGQRSGVVRPVTKLFEERIQCPLGLGSGGEKRNGGVRRNFGGRIDRIW